MAIKDFYPVIRPTLDLNFACSGIVDPRIAFSRSGTAKYFDEFGVMRTAPANTPRIDFDPGTGECKGLLIEEQRTNLLKYSEQFNNAAWYKTNVTITANSIVSPTGVLAANKLVETATTGEHSLGLSASVTSGVSYTFTLFAKAGERSKLRILFAISGFGTDTQDLFDLSTGTVDSNQSGGASIISVGNGWYRVVVTKTATATASSTFQIRVCNTASATNYTGDGTSGLYIWGAQLEVGAFPTSYIPTTSAQVTRAADSAVMTGTNFSSWYRQDEGTLLSNYSRISDKAPGNQIPLMLSDGTGNNVIAIADNANGTSDRVLIINSGLNQSNFGDVSYSSNMRLVRSIGYINDNVGTSVNGSSIASDNSVLIPTVNQLNIGYAPYFTTSRLNGHIKRIAYYPKRLSNINLQALTT